MDGEHVVLNTLSLGLDDAIARLRNLRPVFLGPIYTDILATERGIFSEAGAYAGQERWARLSESTMRRKKSMSAQILVDEGRLMRSVTSPHASGQVAKMLDHDTFEFGTTVPYAEFHQLGTKNMPQRQFIPDNWPDEDVDRWAQIAVEYIMEGEL